MSLESVDEYYARFRAEAAKLPTGERRAVLGALQHTSPPQVFLSLNQLWEAKRLPASWEPALNDFYFRWCY